MIKVALLAVLLLAPFVAFCDWHDEAWAVRREAIREGRQARKEARRAMREGVREARRAAVEARRSF